MSRRQIRRALGLGSVAVIAAAGLALGVATSTQAATPGDITVSSDGVHWSKTLKTPLFADAGLLVPGDSISGTMWIKNPYNGSVNMRVSVSELTGSSSEFTTGVTLSATDSISDETTDTALEALDGCSVIVPSRNLGALGTVKVDLTISMLDLPGQQAQADFGELALRVAMRDDEAGDFPASACDDDAVLIPVLQPITDPTDDPSTPPSDDPTTDPADPADPSDPSTPSDPTDPSDPADPSEPADPSDPTADPTDDPTTEPADGSTSTPRPDDAAADPDDTPSTTPADTSTMTPAEIKAEAERLAMTGYQMPTGLLVGAGGLLMTGFMMLAARRRRRREDA